MKKILPFILIFILSALLISGCNHVVENQAFGTYFSIKINGKEATSKGKYVEGLILEMDSLLSTSNPNSDVSKINNSKANVPIKVSGVTASVFRLSKELYKETNGAYNPAVFPLVELWNFAPTNFVGIEKSIPTQQEIENTLELCSLDYFILNENNSTITKTKEGAKLDFGAITKGYAAESAYTILEHLDSATIDIGRTIKSVGEINVMVANPRKGDFVAKATINNKCIATSGDYERYYEIDGKRYHHIIGLDGYPAGTKDKHPIISATIIGDNGSLCDAFSTAAMVLGYNGIKPIIEKNGYSALLLTELGYYIVGNNDFTIIDETRTKLN